MIVMMKINKAKIHDAKLKGLLRDAKALTPLYVVVLLGMDIFIFILYPILMRNFIELSKPKTTFINLNWNLRYLADFI